jgi:hypothetical protein
MSVLSGNTEQIKLFAKELLNGYSKAAKERWNDIHGSNDILEGIQLTESSPKHAIYTKNQCSIEFRRRKIIIRDSSTSRSWSSNNRKSEWEKGVLFFLQIMGGKWKEILDMKEKKH